MRGRLALVDTNILLTATTSFVRSYNLSGKSIHDVNLIALMHEQNIQLLITQNPSDFPDIELFGPTSFLEAL